MLFAICGSWVADIIFQSSENINFMISVWSQNVIMTFFIGTSCILVWWHEWHGTAWLNTILREIVQNGQCVYSAVQLEPPVQQHRAATERTLDAVVTGVTNEHVARGFVAQKGDPLLLLCAARVLRGGRARHDHQALVTCSKCAFSDHLPSPRTHIYPYTHNINIRLTQNKSAVQITLSFGSQIYTNSM